MGKNNFDFLRFLFAFIVVICHISILSGRPELLFIQKYFNTSIAVSSFFIISGFLVTQSYNNTDNLRKYFGKRARRLLPAYIIVIFLCAILFSFISEMGVKNYFMDIKLYRYLIFNFLFLNFLEPGLPGVFSEHYTTAINGALWTIKVEVSFYILVPLLVYLLFKTQKKYIVLIAIYVLSVLYQYIVHYLYETTNLNIYKILEYQLPGNMTYFACGMFGYYYKSVLLQNIKKLIIPAIVIYFVESYFGFCILQPATLAIIIFFVAYNFKFLNNFGKYGDFSYGIYIFHFPLIQLAIFFGLFSLVPPTVVFSILCFGVITVGFASWHLIEKRFLHRST
jgi:peptidoglycan/LPS O-acetylase OafA/YrhL